MPLESLLELVEQLQRRIDTHGDALRQSEALTRYALIDPLLRELGWDTADPSQVVAEYKSDVGSADYALLSNGRPMMIVEAKKLGTHLQDAVSQVINYCTKEGYDYFAVTDGGRWELYETHKRGNLKEKIVTTFEVRSSPAEICLQALALWRPSVQAGHVAVGQAPIVGTAPNDTDSPKNPPQPTPPRLDEHDWQPMSGLNPPPGSIPPVEVRFPNDSIASVTRWNSILVEIVRWLINEKHLNANHCPIQVRNSKIYRVAVTPVHPDGRKFRSQEQVGAFYVERHGDIRRVVDATRSIIKHVGQEPTQFKVRFS